MQKKVNPIPEGYNTITPFFSLKDAAKAIEFYKNAFGAKEIECHHTEDGRIMHAVIRVGNSMIMLVDEFPDHSCGVSSPQTLKGTTALFHVYVEDADAVFDQAIAAGASVKMPLADMFWGDRYGQLVDPFGHMWSIATHIANPSPSEVDEGAKECFKPSCCKE